MEQNNLIPILYVGKKERKVDTVAGTGLVWQRGEIHYLPPLIAAQLTRYADVWREGWDEADADPARVGLVVTENEVPAGIQSKEQSQVPPFSMPNLQGMKKEDLVAFALGEFNQQLDNGLKKDEMIQQIISLSNSRAAGEPT
ncbi:MAG: hypothetical protein ACN6PJ_15880 [Achromobacter sp.]|uniref:hypothetical protein n=1 Tax=Achromobacter sp. TaxID=134375 RepID=UPI003CFF4931